MTEARVSRVSASALVKVTDVEARVSRVALAALVGDKWAHQRLGTTSVGTQALAMQTDKMYLKRITLPPRSLLASVEARLNTVDGDSCGMGTCLYADDAGAPGRLIGLNRQESDEIKFNGVDRWYTKAVGYYSELGEVVHVGVHAHDAGTSLTLAYETTGGDDRQVDSGGIWTIDPAGSGGSAIDPGSHLYSIRANVITGWSSSQLLGRSTVGASQLALASSTVYVKKVTVPANSLLVAIGAHVAQSIANVQAFTVHLWDDASNAPGNQLYAGNYGPNAALLSATARWLYVPVGRWFDAQADIWLGVRQVGSNGWALSYDASGGADGTKTGSDDSVGGYVAGDDHYSVHAVVLT